MGFADNEEEQLEELDEELEDDSFVRCSRRNVDPLVCKPDGPGASIAIGLLAPSILIKTRNLLLLVFLIYKIPISTHQRVRKRLKTHN